MATNLGTGDIGLFSGGGGSSDGTMGGSSFSSTGVGAALDLSRLQSIQGHTIIDGLTGEQAIGFASLVANTAQKSQSEAIQKVQNSATNFFKSPIFLGIIGIVLFLFTFIAFKK